MPGGFGLGLLVAVIASAVLGVWIAVVAFRRRETPGRNAFGLMALALSAWCLFNALQWLSPPGRFALAADNAAAVVALLSVFLWFVFVVRYTGHGEWLTRGRLAALWAASLLYVAIEFTSPWHGLIRTNVRFASYESLTLILADLQPLAIGVYALAYGLILVTYVLLARFYLRARTGHRRQAATILLASLVPTLSSVVYFAGLRLHPGLDPSALFFLWMDLVVAWALFRHDFLDVAPLATDLLVDEMADPVLILDEDRRIVERNDAARDLLPGDVGSTLEDAVPDLDSAIATDGAGVVAIDTGGRDRIYDVRSTPVADQYDIQRGYLVVLRDVTILRRRERELERQNEQLDRFASVVSHDLRNPLSIAHGYAELARDGDDPDAIEHVLDALGDMDSLIDDVLRLARDGRSVSDPERVTLSEVAEDAWAFVDSDGIEIVVEPDGSFEADRSRLEELLGNLFRNALEHADPSVVRVSAVNGDDEGDVRGFFVEDDGPGVPEGDRDRVFESGFTTAEEGTGLGLAIVRTIAEAHGWSVSVLQGSGGGARFEFRFDDVGEARDVGSTTTDRPNRTDPSPS